jgi:1-acyl-sn-glycerol-3-phosphate acyltransferase
LPVLECKMIDRIRSRLRVMKYRAWRFMIILPWLLAARVARLLYGFRVEGMENVPANGPFILAIHEPSLIGMFVSGFASVTVMCRLLDAGPISIMTYIHQELFALSLFRKLRLRKDREKFAGLMPHSAGNLAMSLLDGYRILQAGGLVVLNPEGDLPWDGRPLPIGGALSWLALHTGAPVVPALCSPGAYDIWPRWKRLPYLRGSVILKFGAPISLTSAPRNSCSDAELAAGTAHLRAEFNRLYYGEAGIEAWLGSPTRHGQPTQFSPVPAPQPGWQASQDGKAQNHRRGLALVLWRCPVCRTEDSLRHEHPPFRPDVLTCLACGTGWEVRHQPGKDFRLKVLTGPQELLGVEMGLATWFDEMKREFSLVARQVNGVTLRAGEQVYLEAPNVQLKPHQPSALLDDWPEREAPRVQPRHRPQLPSWSSIGNGRLLLTSHRLLWQNSHQEVEFFWPTTTAVYLWLQNTLGIRYGSAPYHFALGQEVGLKWLTYANTLARGAAQHRESRPTTADPKVAGERAAASLRGTSGPQVPQPAHHQGVVAPNAPLEGAQ